MKIIVNAFALSVVLLIGSVASIHAQIDNGLDFTTTFSFYAQNTKLPAGSYTVTPVTSTIAPF